jgi:hypothetical protein
MKGNKHPFINLRSYEVNAEIAGKKKRFLTLQTLRPLPEDLYADLKLNKATRFLTCPLHHCSPDSYRQQTEHFAYEKTQHLDRFISRSVDHLSILLWAANNIAGKCKLVDDDQT